MRRAAEAERRHYIIDAAPRRRTPQGSRLLAGGLIVTWFTGSVLVAYWLGEPYLRQHRNDVDPVQARLMADAMSRQTVRRESKSPAVRVDPDVERIDALERRIADAVTQIGAMRQDSIAAVLDEDVRKQISALRADVDASHREIARLQNVLVARNAVGDQSNSDAALISSISGQPSAAPSTPSKFGTRADERRLATSLALGAVALSLAANVVAIVIFLSQRRRTRARNVNTDEAFIDSVGRQRAESSETIDSDPPLRVTGSRSDWDDDSGDSVAACRMVEEMRSASVAGMDHSANTPLPESEPPLLVFAGDGVPSEPANPIDVVAENRLGVDFAVRISDDDRAGLVAQHRGDGGTTRSVA